MTIIANDTSQTPIQKFYAGQNILITGGTGFLGKLLIEKLLRSCPDINALYIIVRSKKGQNAHARMDNLFEDAVFDVLKQQQPKFRHKVVAIEGDCSLPSLGLSSSDKSLLQQQISIVFNVAATVRFDEKLKYAIAINVRGTKEILNLAKSMPELKAMIHVSTAYSNCIRLDIEEKFYNPPITADSALQMSECMSDEILDPITDDLIGKFPNTYAFTKCLAEQVVRQYGKDLPVGIFRPAIVISTYNEPVPGWIDNIYGPTGALVGGGAGLLRTLNIDSNCTAEMVPADMTVNALISTAWDVANKKNEAADPPIYNYSASWKNSSITWGNYINLAFLYGKKIPSMRSIWCYSLTSTKYYYQYYILSIILRIIPAFLMDTGLFICGKRPRMLKVYRKIHKFSDVTHFFSLKSWTFGYENSRTLWENLSERDKELFFFCMDNFNWADFMQKCVVGLRLFIFKDDPNNISIARKRMARMVFIHRFMKYTFYTTLFLMTSYLMAVAISIGSNVGFLTLKEHLIPK